MIQQNFILFHFPFIFFNLKVIELKFYLGNSHRSSQAKNGYGEFGSEHFGVRLRFHFLCNKLNMILNLIPY